VEFFIKYFSAVLQQVILKLHWIASVPLAIFA